MAENNTSNVKGKENKFPVYVLIRVRGQVGVSKAVNDTLDMLKLYRRNFCSVHEATPSMMGMIKKAKDFITWGEVDGAVLKELIEKRAEPNPTDKTRTKSFFRLNSPAKGYGRKGIKKPFSAGGALGYRGSKINDLIKRMM